MYELRICVQSEIHLWYWFDIFGMVLHFLAGACPPSTVTKFVGMDARFAEHTSHAWKKSPEQSVAFRDWYRGPLRMALAQLFMFPNWGMLVKCIPLRIYIGVFIYIYIYRKGVPRQLWSDYCTDSCWICKCMGEKRASHSSIPEHWSNRPLAPPTDTGLTQPLQKGALAAGRQWWARVEPDLNNFPNRIADFSARSPLARKRNTCMKTFD